MHSDDGHRGRPLLEIGDWPRRPLFGPLPGHIPGPMLFLIDIQSKLRSAGTEVFP